jgi:hypothetical protein
MTEDGQTRSVWRVVEQETFEQEKAWEKLLAKELRKG